MRLSDEHVCYIIKDLHQRGIVAEDIQNEIIDHVCSSVEDEMRDGKNFAEAYQFTIARFGHNEGLLQVQREVVIAENRNATIMLKNYLLIAIRNLRKNGFYTGINIAGLAVGISTCIVIVLYLLHELSYDRHHAAADRIYRVDCEVKFGPNHLRLAVAPGPMAEALRNDYPEVEASARFWNVGSMLFRRTEQNFKEQHAAFADSSVFSVFTVPLIQGNPKSALTEPYTMVISKRTAEKYFPGENPVGQTLIVENKDSYKITGVYEDIPPTSHFQLDLMLSLVSADYNKDPNWLSNNFSTYVKLRKGANVKGLSEKMPQMVEKYAGPQARLALGKDFTMEKFKAAGNKLEWSFRPLTDIHLHSDLTAEMGTNSDIVYVYLLSAIALFILGIACINFMNMSTARSANRAKEVGVRKVMGSLRGHLIRQFLTESILLTAAAFVLALIMAWIDLPYFNDLAQMELSLPFGSSNFWLLVLAGIVLIGMLAGLYPSFFLSAFKPVNVLKGHVSLGMKSGLVRSALVVFQFSISIFLIIATLAVNSQLNFIQNKKLGFTKDQIIIVKDAYALENQIQGFKEEVLKDNKVISGTISGFLPVTGTNRNDNTYWPEGMQPTQENMVSLQCWRVDLDYVKTLGMKIKEGRDFSLEFPSDSGAVILNESAARLFGYADAPLGRKISTFGRDTTPLQDQAERTYENYPIIGIVEDFHFESLKQNITPVALFLRKSTGLVSFRFSATHTNEIIQNIESVWKKMAPNMPFSYSFLDEDFAKMYESEQRLGRVFVIFAGLAIIIACLGLFALTAFTAEQRTKEIGIRKVLGASISNIVFLLSKEFGKLVLIAFAIASPAAWYSVTWWLTGYTYKVELGPGLYLIAGSIAVMIAWLTMGFQSIKAASSDPVRSLRSE